MEDEIKRTTSPVIADAEIVEEYIDFPEAITALTIGRKITKKEWGNENVYGLLKDGMVTLHKDDGKFYQWMISDGDLTGTDWYVLS